MPRLIIVGPCESGGEIRGVYHVPDGFDTKAVRDAHYNALRAWANAQPLNWRTRPDEGSFITTAGGAPVEFEEF